MSEERQKKLKDISPMTKEESERFMEIASRNSYLSKNGVPVDEYLKPIKKPKPKKLSLEEEAFMEKMMQKLELYGEDVN